MLQKVLRIGTSAGITLSKEALASLGVQIGDRIKVSVDSKNGTVRITGDQPRIPAPGDREVLAWTEDFARRYRETLENLKDR